MSFSKVQQVLIKSADAATPMRVYKINNRADSILLRTKSEDVIVNPADEVLQTFVERLYSTVRDSMSLGVGIAAPQVGILKNIIWVQRFDKVDFPFEVYLNPKILQYSKKKQDCMEGCLSIPDRRDLTQDRAYAILIEYDQLDGGHQIEMVEDFTAVIFQHEIDHLNGILYLDHLAKEIKDSAQ
ncbi:MAG: peptide deformylase [Bacteroidota bacterium]